jgi:hypothetical protein
VIAVVNSNKSKVGRPKTPKGLAERAELVRIAALGHQVLVSMRRQGRGMHDSERDLRSWLAEDGTAFTSGNLSPALALSEACSKIGRSAAKANSPRSGWLIVVNGDGPVNGSESISGPVITPAVSEAVEAAREPAEAAPEVVAGHG